MPTPRIEAPRPAPMPRVQPTPSLPTPRVERPSYPTPTPRAQPTPSYPSPIRPSPSQPSPVRSSPTPRVERPRTTNPSPNPSPIAPAPSTGYQPPRARTPVAPSPAPDYRGRLRDLYDRRTPPADAKPAPVVTKPIGTTPVVGDAPVAKPREPGASQPPRLRPVNPVSPEPKQPGAPRAGNPRTTPPVSGRYPVPGREPAPIAPGEKPRTKPRDGGSSAPGNRGDVVTRPTTPRVVPPRSNPPRGNPPRSGPPTNRPNPRPSPTPHNPRYDGRTYVGSSRWFYGSWHWSGHCASFVPSYSRWGCYSYPYWYSSWWCRNWYDCNSSFVLWWRSCAPARPVISVANWWWPSSCYYPGTWLGSMSFADWCPDTVDWGWCPPTVIVAPRVETIVVSGDPELRREGPDAASAELSAEEKAAADLRTLADRHLRLGDWYFRQGRFEEAAESYTRALAYAPDDGSVHFVLADALFATGDYHYAAFMIRKGIEFDAGLARADADKRSFYDDPKLFDAQLAALQKYCAEKPYDAAARLVLGYNQRFSGDREGALASFRRVLEIAPGDSAAREFLGALAEPKTPAAAEEGAAASRGDGR